MTLSQRFHHLRYFASDAWDEFRHSPGVNAMAVATLAAVLFLAGLVVLLLSNVERGVERRLADVRVDVYLQEGLPDTVRGALAQELNAREGVESVEYVDKAEALRRYRAWDPGNAGLAGELDLNPLPASFEIRMVPGPEAEGRAARMVVDLTGLDGVQQVRFDREWLRSLERLLDLARLASSALFVLVFAAAIFIIASVLRLAVYARREEIDIMLLVGASPAFVRGPFLVAGLAQGLAASLAALFLVELARRLALVYMDEGNRILLDWVAARPLSAGWMGAILAVGLLVSFTGSWFAARRSI